MYDERDILAELRDSGRGLWSSVECNVTRNHIVVYARLWTHPRIDIESALAESERVLKTVMERRLDGNGRWLAAVHWSERLCKTFSPQCDAQTSGFDHASRVY